MTMDLGLATGILTEGIAAGEVGGAVADLARRDLEWCFPELAALHGVRQDPRWHPEGDVWVHSGLAADQAARLAADVGLAGWGRATIVLAALVHDFGKATSTQRDSRAWRLARVVLRQDRFRVTSRGHAEAGTGPAVVFLDRISCPPPVIAQVIPLVREHMACIQPPTRHAVSRLARRLAPATIEQWAMVCGADHAGRGDPDAPNPAAVWLELAGSTLPAPPPVRGILTGDHLIAAGMTPGPGFREILAGALAAEHDGVFTDEEGAARWLRNQLDRT
jgi:tRNA nucleotidyltransferase (CCA-adding enzyme)